LQDVLVERGDVIIDIYDMSGQKLLSLVEGSQPAGSYQLSINKSDLKNTFNILLINMGVNGLHYSKGFSLD